ncbi:MAG: heavy metal sensor histidine kinase [Candidatus Solibacter usitatus]|nr:heavy metal sensor histidine kinase [Candidatus Solibacter usitatus]
MEKRTEKPGLAGRAVRGLRMRLTASFVLLFALVLVSVGLAFREALGVVLSQQSERVLDQEWAAVRGYLRMQRGELVWIYDPENSDDTFAVERLRRVLLLTDTQGKVMEISSGYSALGEEKAELIQKALRAPQPVTVERRDAQGRPYLVRMGVLRDQGNDFFLAIGLPAEDMMLARSRLSRVYFLMLPVTLMAIAVLGWFAAGATLNPLRRVAEATQTVSAGNLDLRLPLHGSGDELDRLIETFNGMMERLDLNFRQIRQFSIDASHELRTPITAIRGQLEVALFTAESKEEYRDAIVTALEDVERLGQIVKSLLLLAQAESGQLALQKSAVDVSEAVAELADQFRLAAADKGIGLTLEAPESCVAVVDRTQVERLVYHLLSNAVKYTQPGGEVRLTLRREPAAVYLQVSDNGQGIAETHLPHVFERFYRIREGRPGSDQGAGLGLAFVAWVVRAHGGTIEVASVPGKGSRFEITLPAGPAEELERVFAPAPARDSV